MSGGETVTLARIITAGLSQGVTTEDFRAARRGDQSIGNYIADAIIAAGYRRYRSQA